MTRTVAGTPQGAQRRQLNGSSVVTHGKKQRSRCFKALKRPGHSWRERSTCGPPGGSSPELRPFPPHLNSKHTKGAVKRHLQGATPRAPLVEVEGQLKHWESQTQKLLCSPGDECREGSQHREYRAFPYTVTFDLHSDLQP